MSLLKTINPYAIHMIEMKSEYWRLKENQGSTTAYKVMCIQYD